MSNPKKTDGYMVAVTVRGELTVVSGSDLQAVVHEATSAIPSEDERNRTRKIIGPIIEGKEEISPKGTIKSVSGGPSVGIYKAKLV